MTVLERSIASLTYFLDCPIAPMVLHGLEKDGKRRATSCSRLRLNKLDWSTAG